MDQIRPNTPAPVKTNIMNEQLSVQMSWGNGGCTHAGSSGDQQTREFGPWDARRSRAMMRANAWGRDQLTQSTWPCLSVTSEHLVGAQTISNDIAANPC